MKILNANIDWHDSFSNPPTLQILVDKIPCHEDLVYKQKGSLYFAEYAGYVNFYFYDNPSKGFAGRVFEVNVENRGMVKLIGPWSSCSEAMNRNRFTPSLEVNITDEKDVFKIGHTYCAGAITVEKAKEALIYIQGSSLVRADSDIYVVTKLDQPRECLIVKNRSDKEKRNDTK